MTEKWGAAIRTTLEFEASMAGGEWARREKSRTEEPPTEAALADYQRATALLDELYTLDCFDEGYEGVSIIKPRPSVHIEYAETHEEWLARITEKEKREGRPEPTPDPLFGAAYASIAASLARALDSHSPIADLAARPNAFTKEQPRD